MAGFKIVYELMPKPEAICVCCNQIATDHPVSMHPSGLTCIGCYKDEDLLKKPFAQVIK